MFVRTFAVGNACLDTLVFQAKLSETTCLLVTTFGTDGNGRNLVAVSKSAGIAGRMAGCIAGRSQGVGRYFRNMGWFEAG